MLKKTTAPGLPLPQPAIPAPPASLRRRSATAWLAGAVCGLAAFAGAAMAPSEANAQEILLTGPLAGAGAVHELRLYRKGRVEFAPTATFTLQDEYLRQILVGARLNYNITDYLAIGAWGGFSPEALHFEAGLVDRIQQVSEARGTNNAQRLALGQQPNLQNRLTSLNLGNEFSEQLGSIDWVIAPQVTFVPFRGKLALFSAAFIDTDISFFLGPAVIGLQERKPCGKDNNDQPTTACSGSFELENRIAFAPTVGIGWNFYPTTFLGFGAEYRAMPFAWNTSGFDNAGAGNNEAFPDTAVNYKDRQFRVNSMVTVNVSVQIPFKIKTTD